MSHHAPRLQDRFLTRREMLQRCGMGMGALALSQIMADAGMAAPESVNPLLPKSTHFAPKAKRVVHLFMNGGPSQVDTFDPKPELTRRAGQPLPLSLSTERKTGAAFASPFKFQKYGQSGIEVSELFAHTAKHADELCVIRSMCADVPNHEPSLMLMNCGDARQARPSLGSWTLYGLGTENQNLPGFIVMCPGGFPIAESQNWQSAFLPGIFQGTHLDTNHTDIEKLIAHVKNKFVPLKEQRTQLDLLQKLNQAHQERRQRDAGLEARIQSFELAFRMQTEADEVFDVSREPEYIREEYGRGCRPGSS
jgi:hypothetical protein